MMLNSMTALMMLMPEKMIEMAPVVGRVTTLPVRKSLNVTVPVDFQGCGILPVKISQN
jgi:hypothetical protein